MFDVIVWATDGSEAADAALSIAKALAEIADARLVAVHGDEVRVAGPARGHSAHAGEGDTVAKIRGQVERARREGVDAELRVVTCDAPRLAYLIADTAAGVAADLVVVGAHRHPPLSAAAAESVTLRLLGAAPCPVLVVPVAKHPQQGCNELWEPTGIPV
jgi:nucleotide-binding universal stress UspA family protein